MDINVKYGISVISILNAFDDIQKSMQDAIMMGYDGFQSSPLKDITGKEDNIFCYEDVWNSELKHFWQIKKHRIFTDLLQLFVLFSKDNKRKEILLNYKSNNITYVSHTFDKKLNLDDNRLYEISPRLHFGLEKIKKACLEKQILVADTKHILNYKKFAILYNNIHGDVISLDYCSIDNILDELGGNLSPVVHFQPIISIEDFISEASINDDFYLLEEVVVFGKILKAIKENYNKGLYGDKALTIIIEYNPKMAFLSKYKSQRLYTNMLKIVQDMTEYFLKE